ncbi:MAG: hypothetical protein L6Q94_14995 [Calditrichia bacterium]|nr:hypothetical protein [Calditrichia bacterium]
MFIVDTLGQIEAPGRGIPGAFKTHSTSSSLTCSSWPLSTFTWALSQWGHTKKKDSIRNSLPQLSQRARI